MKRRDLITAAVGAVAATVVAGGIAIAASPAPSGVIHGCYQKNSGQLRVLESDSEACRASEVPIAWNAQGPAGVPGPAGANGVDGRDGADGRDGIDGAAGRDGIDGAAGPPGADGRDGIDGVDGAPGRDGIDGAAGAPGADGQDGVSVTSTAEPAGANCSTGGARFTAVNGTTYACNGAKGDKGDTGAPGPSADGTRLWVKFVGGFNPPLVQGSNGVIQVSKLRTGSFRVFFNRDVSACAYAMTRVSGGPIDGALFELGGGGVAVGTSFTAGAAVPTAIDVQFTSVTGTLVDGAGTLIVFC